MRFILTRNWGVKCTVFVRNIFNFLYNVSSSHWFQNFNTDVKVSAQFVSGLRYGPRKFNLANNSALILSNYLNNTKIIYLIYFPGSISRNFTHINISWKFRVFWIVSVWHPNWYHITNAKSRFSACSRRVKQQQLIILIMILVAFVLNFFNDEERTGQKRFSYFRFQSRKWRKFKAEIISEKKTIDFGRRNWGLVKYSCFCVKLLGERQ